MAELESNLNNREELFALLRELINILNQVISENSPPLPDELQAPRMKAAPSNLKLSVHIRCWRGYRMKLWRTVTCITCVIILTGLAIAQETRPSPDLKQRIKTFKNNKRFSVNYDKFKDSTNISVGPFAVSPEKGSVLAMSADFQFDGQTVREDVTSIFLDFVSYSAFRGGGWTFIDHRDLYAIVDGERMELGTGDWKSHLDGLSHEDLTFVLPIGTFKKIAEAKVVELKVGLNEMKLKDEHFIAFKDLLSLTKRE